MRDIKLYRSATNKLLAGVCGGIGECFGIDPNIVRIIWALVTLVSFGVGFILYIIAAIILPKEEV